MSGHGINYMVRETTYITSLSAPKIGKERKNR